MRGLDIHGLTLFKMGGLALGLALLFSCSPVSKLSLNKTLRASEGKFKDHIGFVLYDPVKKKTLFDYQGANYFTPASNTKIFTFYTALSLLKDSIPSIRYSLKGDSLVFCGLGDPSLLNGKSYSNDRVFTFLKQSPQALFFCPSNFYSAHFGPGWAWDDYASAYSAERSPLPLYGNLVRIQSDNGTIKTIPQNIGDIDVRETDPSQQKNKLERDLTKNQFTVKKGREDTPLSWEIPFHTNASLIVQLLADTLNRPVRLITTCNTKVSHTLYSVPSDSLYKTMMQESDNFIAEQLLLQASAILSDSLKPEIAIQYMKKNLLSDLPDPPQWVDGSGLSRYNLFTPRSIVKLWEKIHILLPRERLFPLLAIGGKTGTIRSYYKSEKPYIFGKTGSLSNNHCLSGFLVTKKGKTLIFSFMNSHFTVPTADIRGNMEKILKDIHDHY